MKILDRLERWFGRFAVPHVTLILIGGQVIVYLAMFGTRATDKEGPGVVAEYLALIPQKVLEGQLWRLLTFAIVPPFDNVFFAFLGWYFFWLMGGALEGQWGTFRYNFYLFVGYAATVAVAFAVPARAGDPMSPLYWLGSVFLAFAYLYPDFQIYLFFILPIRIKWMALLTWLGYASGAGAALYLRDWRGLLVILAAVLNFFLFFGWEIASRLGRVHRQMKAQLPALEGSESTHRNRCRICGITPRTHPFMEFRYCSKCDGDCCYCAIHLPSHDHVVKAKT